MNPKDMEKEIESLKSQLENEIQGNLQALQCVNNRVDELENENRELKKDNDRLASMVHALEELYRKEVLKGERHEEN